MLLKCCIQYVSKFRKLSSGQRTRKFQSQRRAMPKNVLTTIQLWSFHMLPGNAQNPFKLAFSSEWTKDFQRYKLDLEKAEESEIKLPTFTGSSKKQGNSRKISTSASLTMPKPLTVWITTNCGQFWKKWEYQTILSTSWETCMQAKKQQLELDMEQWTSSTWERNTSRLYIVTLFNFYTDCMGMCQVASVMSDFF